MTSDRIQELRAVVVGGFTRHPDDDLRIAELKRALTEAIDGWERAEARADELEASLNERWDRIGRAEARVKELEALVKQYEEDALAVGAEIYAQRLREATRKADEWMRVATANAETAEELRAKVERYEKALRNLSVWPVPLADPDPADPQTEYGQMKRYARQALTEAEEWAVGTEWQRFTPEAEGEKEASESNE